MRLQPVQPGFHRRRGLPGARDRAHPREVPDVARRIAAQFAERAAEMCRARELMGIGDAGAAAPLARRASQRMDTPQPPVLLLASESAPMAERRLEGPPRGDGTRAV